MFKTTIHKNSLLIIVLLFFITSSKAQKSESETSVLNSPPSGYDLLFNGKDFSGWNIITQDKSVNGELFSVENGIIHAYPNQKEKSEQTFAGLITDNIYENYILTLEYKWGDKKFIPRNESVRDAGLLFHAFDQNLFWPSSAECQIQEGDTGDLWLIGVRGSSKVDSATYKYSPKGKTVTRGGEEKKRYQSFGRSEFWGGSEWNKIVIEVEGANAKFFVNDKLVNEAINLEKIDEISKKWVPLTKGKILLQAEGAEIFYRNIYIKSL
ncbi:DUF1080 domain-containing protein [Zobellia sp.]|nr:DUF1080 domain-containing protein [Zobellia sp.]